MLIHLILLCVSALCFIIGFCKFFGKRRALFCTLISSAMGCFMMEHLSETLSIAMQGTIPENFHIGMLAQAGGFAFLTSASFAQMDGLVDDRSSSLWRYRIFSFIAPLLNLAFFVPVIISDLPLVQKITGGVLVIFAAVPSYYHLKHIIIPDVSMGIIASIRGYSASALLVEISSVILLTAEKLGYATIKIVAGIILAISYIGAFVGMDRGRKKWTI